MAEPRVGDLPQWQQRAIREADELDEKVAKLIAFLDEEPCRVSGEDKSLLAAQLMAMNGYIVILRMRICRFPAVAAVANGG